jgi:hypothetical protein
MLTSAKGRQEAKSLPSPIATALNAQFINGILYIGGGLNASDLPVNTNYAYDPKTNNWTVKAPMPTARHHLQTAVIGRKLYAVEEEYWVMVSDPKILIPPYLILIEMKCMIHKPIIGLSVNICSPREVDLRHLTHRMGIYVFGGQGLLKDLDSVEKYDPKSDKWTYDTPMPTRRYGLDSVSYDDKIYVLGGQYFTHPGNIPLNINGIFHLGKIQ